MSDIPPSAWHNLFLLIGVGALLFLMAAGLALVLWAGH